MARSAARTLPAVEPIIRVAAAGAPVSLGVPFTQGQVRDVDALAVVGPDDSVVFADRRAFVSWPDGSARWVLFSFIPRVAGAHKIVVGNNAKSAPTPDRPVTLSTSADGSTATLSNGLVTLELGLKAAGPIRSISTPRHVWMNLAEQFQLRVDDATSLTCADETCRTLRVLEQGANRVRVQIEADHRRPDGTRVLEYRLQIELWATMPTVRFDYQFFHKEPGREFIDIQRLGADLGFNFTGPTQRHLYQYYHGEFYEPRDVFNPNAAAIVTDDERFEAKAQSPEMLMDGYKYDRYLDPPLVSTPNWIGVGDNQRSAYVLLHEMSQMRPKRLASEGRQISVDAWPCFAGKLQLPQGRSRRISFSLGFYDQPKVDRDQVGADLNRPFHEGRATVDPDWFSHVRVFEQAQVLPFGKSARFEKFIQRTTHLIFTTDFFDLGDTNDSGYQRSYPSVSRERQPLRAGVPQTPRSFANNGVLTNWLPQSDYEPVWVNNEYDGIHAIASELMRTGKSSHWTSLRWMARHNIEVDFWHHHDNFWLNRISPVHSARHASSGGYPSHFWTQGLLEYYCLTADPDALEVSVALGDAVLRFFHDPVRGKFYRNFDRENGWALLALVHVYDITREERFKNEIDRLVEFFMHGEQANTSDTVGFKDKKGISFNRDLIQRFYFMLNLVEAADLYQSITGRQDIHQWLVQALKMMPEAVLQNFREGGGALSTCAALAIGFERTGDTQFLTAGLARIDELIQDDPRWLNPVPEIKPMAITYREFIRYLGHAYREGLLDGYEYPSLR